MHALAPCKWRSVYGFTDYITAASLNPVFSSFLISDTAVKMSEIEQQYMETSENGHEVDDDYNEAGHTEEGIEESALNDCGEGEGLGADGNSQNGGSEGGQIDASKGEEDAG